MNNIKQINKNDFTGDLTNEPDDLAGLHHGDSVAFTYDQISDWYFTMNGKGYGYFTLRAMLPRLPKEQAEQFKEFLSPNPVPENWSKP